ncbi:hypothetical protein GCM10027076_31460 [Nocardioides montaniterrae]
MRGHPRITCTAKAKSTGRRCGRAPVPGGTTCFVHGGATRAAREAGQRRLREAAVGKALAAWELDQRAQRAAMAPWQDEPALNTPVALVRPSDLRRIAREMNSMARRLREQAAALDGARKTETVRERFQRPAVRSGD